MLSVPSLPGENRSEHFGEFKSRSVKTRDKNSHKLCRVFHQAIKARRACFISFIKLFSILTKRKTIIKFYTKHIWTHNFLSCNCKFSQLGDRTNHITHIIFMLQSYENTLVDQSKCTYYPNYFIKHFTVF